MTEFENPRPLEISQFKPFDAVLVHCYSFREYPKGRLRPGVAGRLQVRAAAELFKRGLVRNIVLPGGKVWGENYPSLSQVMKEELQRRFNISENAIHLIDSAKDTSLEIDLFLKEAQKNGWANLLDLGTKIHMGRIKKLLKNRGALVETTTSEGVLKSISPRFQDFIKKLHRSPWAFTFRLYEGISRFVMIADPDASFLRRLAEKQRTKKYTILTF